jgi:hypothetical protein
MGDRIHWDVKTLPDVQEFFPQPATRKKGTLSAFCHIPFDLLGYRIDNGEGVPVY